MSTIPPRRGISSGSALTAGDFNGDGFADLAIGVPGKEIGSVVDAGAVAVLYGGGGSLHRLSSTGNQFLSEASRGVNGGVAAGDAFGTAAAAGDFDADGFADLAIGVPGKDVGETSDAGR